MEEDDKLAIINVINNKIGSDINNLTSAYDLENELVLRRDRLQSCLNIASNEVPNKLSAAVKKAEKNSKQIENLQVKSEKIKEKVLNFLKKTEPLHNELEKRFAVINKLELVLLYLQCFEKIEDLSCQMEQCSEDEAAVLIYADMKAMCKEFYLGYRGIYIREYTHYWHNILKDKMSKQYEDVMKLVKWPFSTGFENSQNDIPKEVLAQFSTLTRYLFLIQEAGDVVVGSIAGDIRQGETPCLPIRLLLRPLKKRFVFHFTGPRQTARIDRPEWFLTQTLTWIKDHRPFITKHVQPIADALDLKKIDAVDLFNDGLIALAAERLHTVLGLYSSQGAKDSSIDVDAAFAHAVDETLGFHRELVAITGKDGNAVLSVLTKAETFLRWMSVEKKYALAKLELSLESGWQVAAGAEAGAAVGTACWLPRAADCFLALLRTIEDRYKLLPQPGHRLQFLELQLELIEEWRMRLAQLLTAAITSLEADTFLTLGSPHPLVAVINAAHHTRTALLQWAHSLHYLQLHYYRRQFQHYTHSQHRDDTEECSSDDSSSSSDDDDTKKSDEDMSLRDVEAKAKKLALFEVARRNSVINELSLFDITSPIPNLAVTDPLPNDESSVEEAGVFAEAPALLAHLRDGGLTALADHILMEFKASSREYQKQKWHAMLVVEESAVTVSPALCVSLDALAARTQHCSAQLAPPLAARLAAALAQSLDTYILQYVVLDNWFNTGGTIQFTHDVKRNLVLALAPSNKPASQVNQLPKLMEACTLLNMDYDDARRLRAALGQQTAAGAALARHSIAHVSAHDALHILNHRTDLNDNAATPLVLDYF